MARAIRRGQAAFSLIEIVLAVGIISFALVGILGLFPVALDAATAAQDETQVAFIASSIFSGLNSNPPYFGDGQATNLTSSTTENLNFFENGTAEGSEAATDSLHADSPKFLASVTFSPDDPAVGLTSVSIQIVTPAEAPANSAGSTSYSFSSIIRRKTPPSAPPP